MSQPVQTFTASGIGDVTVRITEATPEGCTVEKFTIPSKAMKRDIKVAVLLPPQYGEKNDARFPVLYTLHGASAPYATFAEMGPLRK